MQYFTVFNHLDEPKKYAGVTLIELIVVGGIGLTSFLTQYLALGLIISVLSFRVVRAVSRSPKLNWYKRYLYFHYQDLIASKERSTRFFL
jgi:hypothetical protein